MTEQRKNEIEAMAKELFMTDIKDIMDEISTQESATEYAAGCVVLSKIFYHAFDETIDK